MSRYPNNVDTDTDLPMVMDNITEQGSEAINALREAVIAIEAAIGINPQGSQQTLVDRLAEVLNNDGTFKSSALEASGLVALPIDDDDVGSSAAIKESKLDLDVATQVLQNQLTSNDTDITALQTAVDVLIVKLAQHIGGLAYKHSGVDITISGLTGQSSITTIEAAANFIYNTFLAHKAATVVGEHNASAITFNPEDTGPITATNVQEAIEQIDTAFVEDRRKHNDAAHSNGISGDGYIFYDGQAAVNDVSLSLSRFQPSSGQDILKLGHINAAVVKSNGFNFNNLSASAQSIRFDITVGTATRSITITDLHTAKYPTASNRFALKAVVDKINAAFAALTVHFPLQAYETRDGEIAVQHNIDRSDCSITIKAPSNSALTALGFQELQDIQIGRINNYFAYVDGNQFDSLVIIKTAQLTIGTATSTLNLGVVVDQNGLGLYTNSLIHIYNHTDANSNGTYSIQNVSVSPGTTVVLSAVVQPGTFNYIIYNDTFNIGVSGNPRSFDCFVDSELATQVSTRLASTVADISGVSIVEVSRGLSGTSGTLTIEEEGGRNYLQLTIDSVAGPKSFFDIGYLGYVKVYVNNRVDYITTLITSLAPPTLRTNTISLTDNIVNDDLFFLGTSYYDASATIEMPINQRNIGLLGTSGLGTEITEGLIATNTKNLYSNGIIRGFDTSIASSTSLTILGGTAYVDGNQISSETTTISPLTVASADGYWNVVLGREGNTEIFANTSIGYDMSGLIASTRYTPLTQFTVLSNIITDITDARRFINNIPSKLELIVDEAEDGSGTFRTLDAANLYVENQNINVRSEIKIISDTVMSSSITIAADTIIEAYKDLEFEDDLILNENAKLVVHGTLTATSIILNNNAQIILMGPAIITDLITLSSNCKLIINDDITINSVSFNGSNSSIIGNGYRPTITVDTSGTACITIINENNIIENISLEASSIKTIIKLSTGASNTTINNCKLLQNGTITASVENTNWATARYGITHSSTSTLSNVKITNCEFYNLGKAIYSTVGTGAAIFDNLQIFDSKIIYCGTAIELEATQNSIVRGNIFSFIKTAYLKLNAFTSFPSVHRDNQIIDNIFTEQSSTSTAAAIISLGGRTKNTIISGNILRDIITSGSIISATGTAIVTPLTYGLIISGNILDGCTTGSSYAISLSHIGNPYDISNNIIINHIGYVITCIGRDGNISGNVFSATNTLTAVPMAYFDSNSAGDVCAVSSNMFRFGTNQQITVDSAFFSNNDVITGSFVATDSAAPAVKGYVITGNKIETTNPSLNHALVLNSTSATVPMSGFTNNYVKSSAILSSIIVQDIGSIDLSNNIIVQNTSTYAIKLEEAPGSQQIIASNNTIQVSTGTAYAIYNGRSNVSIIGNTIIPISGFTGPTVAAIHSITGSTNLYINGNSLNGTTSTAKLISHSDSSPTSVYVGINKNATTTITHSILGATFDPDKWTYLSKHIESSSITANELAIPLHGLPIGSKLVSVIVYATASAVSQFTADLNRKVSTGGVTVVVATTANTNLANIVLTPTSHYILKDNEYFVEITASATGVVLNEIIVNIEY